MEEGIIAVRLSIAGEASEGRVDIEVDIECEG